MRGVGTFGLTAAGQAQLAQVLANAAARQAELDALPPAEQAAIQFEDLMSRWPVESKFLRLLPSRLYMVLGYKKLLDARHDAWLAELFTLMHAAGWVSGEAETALMHIIRSDSDAITAASSRLICGAKVPEVRSVFTAFANRLHDLVGYIRGDF